MQQRAAGGGDLLAHDGELRDAHAAPAVVLRQVHTEEAGLAQLEPELVRLGVARRRLLEVAVTVPGREAGDSLPEQLLFLRGTEIHCHCSS